MAVPILSATMLLTAIFTASSEPSLTPGYDLDCSDVTWIEAQDLLAANPRDPFDLDRDHDGIACECNPVLPNDPQTIMVGCFEGLDPCPNT